MNEKELSEKISALFLQQSDKLLAKAFGKSYVKKISDTVVLSLLRERIENGELKRQGKNADGVWIQTDDGWCLLRAEHVAQLIQNPIPATVSMALRALTETLIGEMPVISFNSHAVNFANGYFDYLTGEFHAGEQVESYYRISCDYVQDDDDFVLETLSSWAGGDPEIMSILMAIPGYVYAPTMRERCFFWVHGRGRDGKSTWLNLICEVLDNAHFVSIQPSKIADKFAQQAYDRAILRHCDDASGITISEDAAAQEKTECAGGYISVEHKGVDPVSIACHTKSIALFNTVPRIKGRDAAISDRLCLLEWAGESNRRLDPDFTENLMKHAAAFASMAVRAYSDLWRNGQLLTELSAFSATRREYRIQNDTISGFIDWLGKDIFGFSGLRDLHERYKQYCDDMGIEEEMRLRERNFGVELKQKFDVEFDRHARAGARIYVGARWADFMNQKKSDDGDDWLERAEQFAEQIGMDGVSE